MAKSRTGNKKSWVACFSPPVANLGQTTGFHPLALWEASPAPGLSPPPKPSQQDSTRQPSPIQASLPGALPALGVVAFSFPPELIFHMQLSARGTDSRSHFSNEAREPGNGCWPQV